MSDLSHQGAFRLIYKRRRTEAEQGALRGHLQHCPECRQDAEMAGLFNDNLVLKTLPTRPSPKFSAVYREQAARRSRRSQIMRPIYAVGGAVALALIVLAGWFIVRANPQDTTLDSVPVETVVSVVPDTEETPAVEVTGESLNEQLIAAVEAGDAAEVEQLLEAGASSGIEDSKGNAALAKAARAGQLEIVQLLLDAGADVNSTATTSLAPAIYVAAGNNHLEVVELLIAYGADVNLAEKSDNVTALLPAAYGNSVDIVKVLLENGADPNWHSSWNEGETPLHWAAMNGSVEAAEALLDGGAFVDVQTDEGTTPLMKVIFDGNINARNAVIPLLLDHGAAPNIRDRFGNSALHLAAGGGTSDVIVPLLEGGSLIDLQNNLGETALHLAALAYQIPALEILIEQGASLDIENNEGRTALDVAPNDNIRQILREAGATSGSQAETSTLDEQLFAAVEADDVALVEQLLDADADPNVLDDEGNALLPLAAKEGELEIVRLLLVAGADIDSTLTDASAENETALSHAALGGHIDILKLLIANGADVDKAETLYNRTPLHGVSWYNDAETVKILLEGGADPNPHSTYGKGETPLHFAVRNGSYEAIQALLEGGVDPNSQTDSGVTPLMMASNRELLTILLEGGANPDVQDNRGETALHRAARAANEEFLSLLIERGASVDLENNQSQTALDVAANDNITEMLREANAE